MFEKGDFMETIRNVEINQLHDFKNHPFKVEVNTELCELMQSIEKDGVLKGCLACGCGILYVKCRKYGRIYLESKKLITTDDYKFFKHWTSEYQRSFYIKIVHLRQMEVYRFEFKAQMIADELIRAGATAQNFYQIKTESLAEFFVSS